MAGGESALIENRGRGGGVVPRTRGGCLWWGVKGGGAKYFFFKAEIPTKQM